MKVVHYFDYKSPYAYLAQEETWQLAETFPAVEFEWLPYTLDIPSFLGRAELDPDGRVLVDERNPHQWRRVRYAYMDCRREAARRGLVIRGPRRIFDSSIAHVGMLYARARGRFRPYHERVFERFWNRALDLDDAGSIAAVLAECGVDTTEFPGYLAGEGRAALARLQTEAEDLGVFGVPSYVVGGELFWGNERIPRVRETLEQAT